MGQSLSYQVMGDSYLLATIAAIVLDGTNVLGRRGSHFGSVAGLQPQLFFADLGFRMPAEVFRQIVFGMATIAMLLLYRRERR